MLKAPLSPETMLKLNARLQAYRQQAEERKTVKVRIWSSGGRGGLPLFRKYPPEVQEVCWQHYNSLCVKHKAKLDANPWFKCILVATATRVALEKLGLKNPRIGLNRMRIINQLKVALGIRDVNIDNAARMKIRRKRAKASAKVQKLNVSQLPLEC